jgi:hypothetical protein
VNNIEKQYKSQGCDVSLARLRRNCEFLAPPDMHSEIKDKFEALAQIQDTTFTIDEPGFEILISKEPERLTSLVKSKCFLEKTIETCRVHIPIPKARVADLEDGIKQPTGATASALPNTTSVTINHSTLTILTGDLATQKVSVFGEFHQTDELFIGRCYRCLFVIAIFMSRNSWSSWSSSAKRVYEIEVN